MQYAVFIFLKSNNLILIKASLGIGSYKWSAVAGVSVFGVEGCGSLPSVSRALECEGITVLEPWRSGSTRSVLFGDIGPAGLRHMVGGSVSFFSQFT